MFRASPFVIACVALLGVSGQAQVPEGGPAGPRSPLVERVGDTGFIQIQSPSFSRLDDRQKALAYWLSKASIAIDPIIYDQLSRFGLREKRLLEGIVGYQRHATGSAVYGGIAPETFAKIREYALLFWANRGNHNET